jgi:hypothetical protein
MFPPYTAVATGRRSASRMNSAMRPVGHGIAAMVIRKTALSMRKVWVVRSMRVNMWWWFTHMIPMVRKLTTYAA